MSNGTARVAVLGLCGAALVALAALVLPARFSAHTLMKVAHRHAVTVASSNRPSESTFYFEMSAVNARMHEAMQIVPSGDIDRDFMQMMIPHHQAAIDMAIVLLKDGRDEKLKRLAQSIIVEQAQEISYMNTLLGAPAVETSTPHPSTDK